MDTMMWQPKAPEKTQMAHFIRFVEQKEHLSLTTYHALYQWSIEHPARFWGALVEMFNVQFSALPREILTNHKNMLGVRWFVGAKLNYAEKLLLRNDEHPAIVSLDEQGKRVVLSYRELREQVLHCAAGLHAAGIRAGDRVAGRMPNVNYTVIAFLATATIGAIWSSCSPDFGDQATVDRFGQITSKILFVSDGHWYQGKCHDDLAKTKEIAALIPSLQHVVICPVIHSSFNVKDLPNACTWDDFLSLPPYPCFEQLPFNQPLYILFSSGTTGKPKCIVHGAGGVLLQHLKELGLHTDIKEQDNLLFYTTCGWMMWNWMISVLALGATLTLYEGSPTFPNPEQLFSILENERVTVFGTSAKFISVIEKEGIQPRKSFSLRHLRTILTTGSPLLPKHYDYIYQEVKPSVQLCSISGGTDIVSCFALGNPLLPVYRGELQCIGLGMSVAIYDEQGEALHETRGELVCTKPFPTMPLGFWNDIDQRAYRHAYFERFPGIWAHGDFAALTRHGGLIIYGRSDAVLNPGGVRIGTAEIYRQIEKIPEVIDSIVIGQDWEEDVRVVLFVKLRPHLQLDEALQQHIRTIIRSNASPRHVPAKILQVDDIPHTMNGKIVELAVKQAVQGEAIQNLNSIANPEALAYFCNRVELQNKD